MVRAMLSESKNTDANCSLEHLGVSLMDERLKTNCKNQS
jgi:hypothetical protein